MTSQNTVFAIRVMRPLFAGMIMVVVLSGQGNTGQPKENAGEVILHIPAA